MPFGRRAALPPERIESRESRVEERPEAYVSPFDSSTSRLSNEVNAAQALKLHPRQRGLREADCRKSSECRSGIETVRSQYQHCIVSPSEEG